MKIRVFWGILGSPYLGKLPFGLRRVVFAYVRFRIPSLLLYSLSGSQYCLNIVRSDFYWLFIADSLAEA